MWVHPNRSSPACPNQAGCQTWGILSTQNPLGWPSRNSNAKARHPRRYPRWCTCNPWDTDRSMPQVTNLLEPTVSWGPSSRNPPSGVPNPKVFIDTGDGRLSPTTQLIPSISLPGGHFSSSSPIPEGSNAACRRASRQLYRTRGHREWLSWANAGKASFAAAMLTQNTWTRLLAYRMGKD